MCVITISLIINNNNININIIIMTIMLLVRRIVMYICNYLLYIYLHIDHHNHSNQNERKTVMQWNRSTCDESSAKARAAGGQRPGEGQCQSTEYGTSSPSRKNGLVELGWLILYGLIHDVDIIWVDIWCWYYMGWYSQWYMLTFIRWTFWCCYMGLCIKMGKWPHRPAFACSWFARSNQTNRSSWYSWNIRSVWLQAFPYNGTDHDGCRSVQNQSTQLMFFPLQGTGLDSITWKR